MLLTVSAGNSNVAYGIFEGTELVRHDRVPIREVQLLAERIGEERFQSVALASVVPSRTDQIISLLALAYSAPVLLAGRDLPFDIDIRCDQPDGVGDDRLLNAIAAFARTNGATVIVDAGTAVTVDVVTPWGAFGGGAIAPGPDTMLRALHQGAELLPEIALGDSPPAAIGRNTADAMRSGAWWGSVGVIESLVTRIKAEQTGSIDVIITGGHAEWLAREMKETPEIVPALTLEGLAILVARTAT